MFEMPLAGKKEKNCQAEMEKQENENPDQKEEEVN